MAKFNAVGGATVLGGDPQQMKNFGTFLTGTATEEFKAILTKIDGEIAKTTWSGKDATTFETDWEADKKKVLDFLTTSFGTTADKIKAQAEEQERASGMA
jgi:hypothetical protein